MKYFKQEMAEWGESYSIFKAVPDKYVKLFLYNNRDEDWELVTPEEVLEYGYFNCLKEVERFKPLINSNRVSTSPFDITELLSDKYEDYIRRYASYGQDPSSLGASCSIYGEPSEEEIEKYKLEKPKRQYIEERFEKELSNRKVLNSTIDENEYLLKNL